MIVSARDRVKFVSRALLGFLFIYHGLVPKILWLSPDEVSLVSASGSGISADIVSPIAGIAEIILGLLIIFNRSLIPVYIAAVMLALLLLFVVVASPSYLVGAFNPVTTNLLGLGFCYLIVFLSQNEDSY